MRALITGVTGQDGSYLAEFLTQRGYEVYGMIRTNDHPRRKWIERIAPGVHLLVGNLLDQKSLERVVAESQPDEIYNVAAVTSPGNEWGFTDPPLLGEVTGLGPVRLLLAVEHMMSTARVVHVSSSTIYDKQRYGLYGAAKRLAHDAVDGFRARGIHASNAVLFSHTSPRQPSTFLIRRITAHVAGKRLGKTSDLRLTNLGNSRDWGHASDYAQSLWYIAQSEPDSYDVLTGDVRSVGDIVRESLCAAQLSWSDVPEWHDVVNEPMITEVVPSSPHVPPGWQPHVTFSHTVAQLVTTELAKVRYSEDSTTNDHVHYDKSREITLPS